MIFALTLLFRLLIVLAAGWFIRDAIVAFKKQQYFLFGFNIMLIFWEIMIFVDTFFTA